MDEAHIIRNYKSLLSESSCKLKGFRRWVLTGTPINNREMDLYSLIKFLRCSPFNELTVYKKFIEKSQERLNTLLKHLILRRTKSILQANGHLVKLPEKSSKIINVTLEKDEMNVYQTIMSYSKTLFEQFLHQRNERNDEKDFIQSSTNYKSSKNFIDNKNTYAKIHQHFTKMHGTEEVKSHQILVLLLRLRQICCHPGLINSVNNILFIFTAFVN